MAAASMGFPFGGVRLTPGMRVHAAGICVHEDTLSLPALLVGAAVPVGVAT